MKGSGFKHIAESHISVFLSHHFMVTKEPQSAASDQSCLCLLGHPTKLFPQLDNLEAPCGTESGNSQYSGG